MKVRVGVTCVVPITFRKYIVYHEAFQERAIMSHLETPVVLESVRTRYMIHDTNGNSHQST